jgi:hypothetical protein
MEMCQVAQRAIALLRIVERHPAPAAPDLTSTTPYSTPGSGYAPASYRSFQPTQRRSDSARRGLGPGRQTVGGAARWLYGLTLRRMRRDIGPEHHRFAGIGTGR